MKQTQRLFTVSMQFKIRAVARVKRVLSECLQLGVACRGQQVLSGNRLNIKEVTLFLPLSFCISYRATTGQITTSQPKVRVKL